MLPTLRVTAFVAKEELRRLATGISNVKEWGKRSACWGRIIFQLPILRASNRQGRIFSPSQVTSKLISLIECLRFE
jgi:hypothetical protein